MIKTVSPLKEWEHLKFWKYYFDSKLCDLEGYPAKGDRFKALELTSPPDVRAVILGQDPYPTKGHANGLAFSTYPHVSPLPRSLGNIFTEYTSDLGYNKPSTGDLHTWANNGILLLNSVLTVEEGKPGSHKGLGWEKLTYEILRDLNLRDKPVAFILWGKEAQAYRAVLSNESHGVFCSPHPSPLSAGKGFFNSKPFSKAAEFLGVDKDIWKLP